MTYRWSFVGQDGPPLHDQGSAALGDLVDADATWDPARPDLAPELGQWVWILADGRHVRLDSHIAEASIVFRGRVWECRWAGGLELRASSAVVDRVTGVFSRVASTIITLEVRANDGTVITLAGTPEHPVRTEPSGRFVAMGSITEGSMIATGDGGWATVVRTTASYGKKRDSHATPLHCSLSSQVLRSRCRAGSPSGLMGVAMPSSSSQGRWNDRHCPWDDESEDQLMNSSVGQLANCLLIYRDFVAAANANDSEALLCGRVPAALVDQLERALRTVDRSTAEPDSFWFDHIHLELRGAGS
jgi:hypothetical protein